MEAGNLSRHQCSQSQLLGKQNSRLRESHYLNDFMCQKNLLFAEVAVEKSPISALAMAWLKISILVVSLLTLSIWSLDPFESRTIHEDVSPGTKKIQCIIIWAFLCIL